MTTALTLHDLRFVNRVATRRFAAAEPAPLGAEDAAAASLAARNETAKGTAFVRAATLVADLLREGVFASAPLQSALLVLHCSLVFDGVQLLAPQGVVAGMIKDVAAGGDPAQLARWLEDRSVPATGGG